MDDPWSRHPARDLARVPDPSGVGKWDKVPLVVLPCIINIVILINFERFALTPSPSPRAGEGSQESP